jgi:ornithine cyclodeaminase
MTSSKPRTQHVPSLYTLEEINKVISKPSFETDLIHAIQEGFVALEKGEFFACPIQTMGLPPFPFVENVDGYNAQTCVKSGYFKGQDYYVIKVASGGYPMENSGLMQVYSQKSGKLEALLLDDGILTEIRTAAVGALAAKLLAPKQIRAIGIMGTGIQARYQLNMLPTATDCRKVFVWGRSASKAQAFRDEMVQKGWQVSIAETTTQLLEECDLIVTTTCAREPLLRRLAEITSRQTGLHITCIGADAPGKTELDPEVVAKADLLVADTIQQTVERGEFQKAVADGLVDKASIVSLGNLITREDLHRKESMDQRITVFDSSGVALQDCVVSQMTYDALRQST